MGVNICIVDRATFEDVPGWDPLRYAGDRDVHSILHTLPCNRAVIGGEYEGAVSERPDDVEAFRAALHARFDYNTERWDLMCDLLAADPNRGLYFSY